MKIYLFPFIILFFFISCKSSKPTSIAHQEVYNTFVSDEVNAEFNIPLSISTGNFKNLLNEKFPSGTIFFEEDGIDLKHHLTADFKVTSLTPIEVFTQEGKIGLRFRANIYSKINYSKKIFFAKINKEAEDNIQTTLTTFIIPKFNNEWEFDPIITGEFSETTPITLHILGFDIKLSSLVKNNLKKQFELNVKPALLQAAKENIDLKGNIEKELSKFKKQFQVCTNPVNTNIIVEKFKEINLSTFKSDDLTSTLQSTLHVKGIVKTMVGNNCNETNKLELPQLGSAESVSDEFLVQMPVFIETAAINEYLEKENIVVNHKIKKREIVFSNFSVSIHDPEHVLVKSYFISKKSKGWVEFIAKPVMDNTTNELKLEDLDFSLKTSNALLKYTDFLAHKKIKKKIQEAFKYNPSVQLNQLKDLVNKQVSSREKKELQLGGGLESLKINNLVILENHILINSTLKGRFRITI